MPHWGLSDTAYRRLIRDEHSQAAGPGGHPGGGSIVQRGRLITPHIGSSDQSLPRPASRPSTTRKPDQLAQRGAVCQRRHRRHACNHHRSRTAASPRSTPSHRSADS